MDGVTKYAIQCRDPSSESQQQCMLCHPRILYCHVHICTQRGIGVDKDKTTTEEIRSTKRYGGWGTECRRTHGRTGAEKRSGGQL